MPNDNRSEHLWKNRLENLSSVPGEVLTDKNATWDKLHNRLSRKPRRTRAIWYWAAAACLLLAFILPIIPGKKHDVVVRNNTGKIPVESSESSGTPAKESASVITSSSSIQTKGTSKIHEQVINKRSSANTAIKENNAEVESKNFKVNIEDPTVLTPAINDTVSAIAVVPAKKQLRVVHINELDNGESSTNITLYDSHHSLRLKFINPEVYTSFSLPSARTGFAILKQKQAPSN